MAFFLSFLPTRQRCRALFATRRTSRGCCLAATRVLQVRSAIAPLWSVFNLRFLNTQTKLNCTTATSCHRTRATSSRSMCASTGLPRVCFDTYEDAVCLFFSTDQTFFLSFNPAVGSLGSESAHRLCKEALVLYFWPRTLSSLSHQSSSRRRQCQATASLLRRLAPSAARRATAMSTFAGAARCAQRTPHLSTLAGWLGPSTTIGAAVPTICAWPRKRTPLVPLLFSTVPAQTSGCK